jgi:hypothetical protein
MPHFVGIPATANSPGLSSLALKDRSGNAAIAVWAAGMDWEIRLCAPGNAFVSIPSNRFQSPPPYKKDANLHVYFMLRGLKAGDNISAYDASGRPQTGALPITSVSTDRPSNNLSSRPSAFSSKLILNPAGAEQADLKTTGQDWVTGIEKVIKYILANEMGRLIVNSMPGPVNIFPFLSGEQNANSAVQFSPKNFSGSLAPGAQPNEILFHEFCHIADGTLGTYVDLNDPEVALPFQYDKFDFFSVNATNVYASMRGRPLRKDHLNFQNMPAKFKDFDKFWDFAKPNLDKLRAAKPIFIRTCKRHQRALEPVLILWLSVHAVVDALGLAIHIGPTEDQSATMLWTGKNKKHKDIALQGCAGHAPDRPAVTIAATAFKTTMADEVGHVLLSSSFYQVHTDDSANPM